MTFAELQLLLRAQGLPAPKRGLFDDGYWVSVEVPGHGTVMAEQTFEGSPRWGVAEERLYEKLVRMGIADGDLLEPERPND